MMNTICAATAMPPDTCSTTITEATAQRPGQALLQTSSDESRAVPGIETNSSGANAASATNNGCVTAISRVILNNVVFSERFAIQAPPTIAPTMLATRLRLFNIPRTSVGTPSSRANKSLLIDETKLSDIL